MLGFKWQDKIFYGLGKNQGDANLTDGDKEAIKSMFFYEWIDPEAVDQKDQQFYDNKGAVKTLDPFTPIGWQQEVADGNGG